MPDGRNYTRPDAVLTIADDERRPRRVAFVSHELEPRPRHQSRIATDAHARGLAGAPPDDDPLGNYGDPIRGFGIAIAVAIPLWILIVLSVLFLLFPTHR
jgi:hypothetical protein